MTTENPFDRPEITPTRAQNMLGFFDRHDAYMLGLECAVFLNILSFELDGICKHQYSDNVKDGRIWFRHSVVKWHNERFSFISKRTLIRKIDDLIEWDLVIKTDAYTADPKNDPNRWFTINDDQYGAMRTLWISLNMPAVYDTKKHQLFIEKWKATLCQNVTTLCQNDIGGDDKMTQGDDKMTLGNDVSQGENQCQNDTQELIRDYKDKELKDSPAPAQEAAEKIKPEIDAQSDADKARRKSINAIIDVWSGRYPQPSRKNVYAIKAYQSDAGDLFDAGCTSERLAEFIGDLQKDPFWADKPLSLEALFKRWKLKQNGNGSAQVSIYQDWTARTE